MNVSGTEAVVAASSPFFGQGESVMLIKPFLPIITKAEMHQVMVCADSCTVQKGLGWADLVNVTSARVLQPLLEVYWLPLLAWA